MSINVTDTKLYYTFFVYIKTIHSETTSVRSDLQRLNDFEIVKHISQIVIFFFKFIQLRSTMKTINRWLDKCRANFLIKSLCGGRGDNNKKNLIENLCLDT